MSVPSASPELSRIVDLADLEGGPTAVSLTATPEECAALSARLGILKVAWLTAEATIRPLPGGGAEADFTLAADIEQQSVISLEPVATHLAEAWTVKYLPTAVLESLGAEGEVEITGEEGDIEFIEGATIDIGETVAQQVCLALDPYPRQSGESLEDYWSGDGTGEEEAAARSPFDVLKVLKHNT